ncbi:glycosyltransferase family 2 protein [Aerococcus agrisoli]|uniref:glycosyltransferase family 2 protein n=1 Tax=Aerococcus agrisoli TaxID=2487350 RepID=UPI00131561EF|nr:glycosyltransferase family 2 protein [Aerococcus agrisoli]
MNILTIFTPTYNRATTIGRVYTSLLAQTNKSFEWFIIDDGSKDNTKELVEKWINEDKIPIKYVKQANSGKIKSINKSLKETKTPLWICLDSDDWFTPDAVEIIINNYNSIKDDEKICGMIALRSNEDLTPMQDKFIPSKFKYLTQGHLRYNLKIGPEYAQVYKTDIIKNYLYPEINGENYFPLSYMADELDRKYELLVIHDPIMIIEYQENGITKNNKKHVKNNPIGHLIFRHNQFETAPNLMQKIKSGIAYNSATIIAKKRIPYNKKSDSFLSLLLSPIGFIDYIWRFKRN